MDGIMNVGTIGEMGRTVMKATQNMTPEQKQEYFRQAALNGIDPRVNNVALLQIMSMQLDRLKQPPVQPAQGGTIRQQLNQAVAVKNQQEQETALRAQIAEAMQRKAMEQQAAMDQGIAGLDTGAMERAEYAGGGIVGYAGGGPIAFDKGGPTTKRPGLESLIAAQENELRGGLDEYTARTMEAQEALRQKYGVGRGSEYDKAMQEEIARLQEQAAGYGERAGREDLAAYFFNVAAEAAKPGATFLGSYAKAAPAYAAARKETQKATIEANSQARQARLKMLQAQDLERRGDIDNAFKLYHEGKKELNDAVVKLEQIRSNREMVNAQMASGATAREIEAQMAKLDLSKPDEAARYNNLNKKLQDIKFGSAVIRANSAGKKLLPGDQLRLKQAGEAVKAVTAIYGAIDPNHPKIVEVRNAQRSLMQQLEAEGYEITREDLGEPPAAPATGQPSTGGAMIYNPQTGKIEPRK